MRMGMGMGDRDIHKGDKQMEEQKKGVWTT